MVGIWSIYPASCGQCQRTDFLLLCSFSWTFYSVYSYGSLWSFFFWNELSPFRSSQYYFAFAFSISGLLACQNDFQGSEISRFDSTFVWSVGVGISGRCLGCGGYCNSRRNHLWTFKFYFLF